MSYSPDELANIRRDSAPGHDDEYPGHIVGSDGHCHTCDPYRRYTFDDPLPGHEIREYRFNRGRSVLGGGVYYGTKVRCGCGAIWKINEAPSKGGRKAAQAWYERHVEDALHAR